MRLSVRAAHVRWRGLPPAPLAFAALSAPSLAQTKITDRLHRDHRLRLGDGRGRPGHFRQTWARRANDPDRHQFEYSRRDRVRFDPVRRPDRHPSSCRRSTAASISSRSTAPRRWTRSPIRRSRLSRATGLRSRSPRISSARKSARRASALSCKCCSSNGWSKRASTRNQVNFVEVTFPTMNDTLKSGAVDAVLTAEPFVDPHQSGRQRLCRGALRGRTRAHRADHLLCRRARLRGEEPGGDRQFPRRHRRGRRDRQQRPREGERSRSPISPSSRSKSSG